MNLRNLVAKTGTALTSWGEREAWRQGANEITLVRRGPVRFPSRDALAQFLEQLDANAERISVNNLSHGRDWSGVAGRLAARAEGDRNALTIIVFNELGHEQVIMFGSDRTGRLKAPEVIANFGVNDQTKIILASVDHFTRPAKRADHKVGRRLVDPIDVADELKQSVARSHARAAAGWGALAGFGTAIVAQILGSLLSG